MPSPHRDTRLIELYTQLAAEFIVRTASPQSLITATRTEVSEDTKHVTIYVSVMPEKLEATALSFLKRERSAFREYIKKNSALQRIPTFDFALDLGEKNRQNIEKALRGPKKM